MFACLYCRWYTSRYAIYKASSAVSFCSCLKQNCTIRDTTIHVTHVTDCALGADDKQNVSSNYAWGLSTFLCQ